MAQEAVNSILQAFQNSLQMRMARDQSVQDKEFRQKQFEEEQKQNKIHQDAAAKLYDLQKAQLEAAQAEQEFKNAEIFQKTGITPPGTESIKGQQAPQQPPTQVQVPQINQSTPVPGQPGVGVGSVYPGLSDQGQQKPLVLSDLQNSQLINKAGRSLMVPPLEQRPDIVLAQRQAQEARAGKVSDYQAEQQAAERRQLNVMQATQEAEGKRLLMSMAQEHDYRTDEIQQQRESAEKIARMNNQTQLQLGRMRTGGGLEDFANMPNAMQVLTGLKSGTVSQEEVNRNPFKKQITKYAMENGIQILPQAKTNQIQALETMGNMLPTIRRMIMNRELNPGQINNPFSNAGIDYKKDAETIRAAAPQASVATTGVRRFTQQELARFDEFFLPHTMPLISSTKANMDKYNEFVMNLNQAMEQVTKGLSTEQRESVRTNLQSKGLTFMKDMGLPSSDDQGGQPTELPQGTQNLKNLKVPSRLTGQEPVIPLGPVQPGLKIWKPNPKTGVLEMQTGGQ